MALTTWLFERQLTLRHRALRGYDKIKTMMDFEESRFYGKHLSPHHLGSERGKCSSANALDIACPYKGPDNYISELQVKSGIHLIVILAKILPNWLAEITKLIDFTDRSIMQLRCFYVQSNIKYKNISGRLRPLVAYSEYDYMTIIEVPLRLSASNWWLRFLAHKG